MSLSVPQNGIKADNEPIIELFVKVRFLKFCFSYENMLNYFTLRYILLCFCETKAKARWIKVLRWGTESRFSSLCRYPFTYLYYLSLV